MAKNQSPKRTLSGWSKSSLEKGSPAYQRYLNRLNDQILVAQFDMTQFADSMEEWANPKSAEGKARRFNDTYCECMINMCFEPLQQGLDGDSVVESIGMFVSMSVLSKDFRQKCNLKAADAIMPYVKNRAMKVAEKRDMMASIGHMAGMKNDAFKESYQERTERKINERWDKIRTQNNGGRPFFTPEAAATKYLGFCQQAYNMMRTDTPDMAQMRKDLLDARQKQETERAKRLQESLDNMEQERNRRVMNQFERASKSLQTVAEMDGVTAEDFTRAVNKVYGTVSDRYPQMQRVFDQTVFGNVSQKYDYKTDPKTGKTTRIWNGDLCYEDGTLFNELLTPRAPMSKNGCINGIKDAYVSLYEPCETLEAVEWVHQQVSFADAEPYLKGILEDDLPSVWASERPDMSFDAYVEDILMQGHGMACDQWVKERTEPEENLRKQAEAAEKAERQRRRDEYAEAKEQREQRAEARAEEKAQREQRAEARAEAKAAREQEEHDAFMDSIKNGKVYVMNPNGFRFSQAGKKAGKGYKKPAPKLDNGTPPQDESDADKDNDFGG